MKNRRNVNVRLCWVEHKVDSNYRTTLTLADGWRDGRKQQVNIILKDLPPYMVAHLAEQCMESLRVIEKRVAKEIADVHSV